MIRSLSPECDGRLVCDILGYLDDSFRLDGKSFRRFLVACCDVNTLRSVVCKTNADEVNYNWRS